MRLLLVVSALLAVLLVAPRASAQNESGAAAAESLFQEGRKLMDAKRYSEACPKFAASQKLGPALGTLLNLADCYEKNNQLASAWARFHEAIALAQRLGRSNREQTARERADKLEPRLIKLTILSRSSAVDVKLDGNPVERGALGTPIPVDAGKHTVEASAKGKKPFSTTIDVTEKVRAPSVEIPVLDEEGKSEARATAPGGEPPATTPPPEEPKGNWTGRKTIAVIAFGVGIVGLGVGTYYGLNAQSTWKETLSYCSADYECDEPGIDLAAKAKRFGNYSTYGFIAGGVLVAAGAVLFITAPNPKKTAGSTGVQRIGFGPGSIVLGGTF